MTDESKLFQKPIRHKRRWIRLEEYDYSQPGGYFVTIEKRGHKCIFGKITSSKMLYYEMGRISKECCLLIPDHFSKVEIDPYVVMPNQIHGVITIHDDLGRGTIYRTPTENTNVNGVQDLNKLNTQDKSIENFGRPLRG
jgi:putative transposase